MSAQIKIDDAEFLIDETKWLLCDMNDGTDAGFALDAEEARQLLKFLQENL